MSGSASDTATFLDKAQFSWVEGQDCITRFQTGSGYRSEFCKRCGSTLPHLMDDGFQYWIPAGLLADTAGARVAAHIFVDSKAAWDNLGEGGSRHATMPSMKELSAQLHRRASLQTPQVDP